MSRFKRNRVYQGDYLLFRRAEKRRGEGMKKVDERKIGKENYHFILIFPYSYL